MPPSLTRPRGLAILVLSSVTFGFMAYVAKQATFRLDGAQVAFVRFVIGIAVTAGFFVARGAPPRVVRPKFLILRGVFGGFAVLLYFLSLAALPTGTATLLNYTAPIFTAIFAATFLREYLPRLTFFAMGIAAVGVTLVVYGQGKALGGAYGWQLIALGSAVMSGGAVTSIRAARRTDGAWEVFGAFCVLGAVCTAPLGLLHWKNPTPREWWLLVGVGLLSVIAQVLMTHALGAVEAALSGIIAQITVVTAMGLGHFLDDEPLTAVSLIGAALTLIGVSVAANVSARTIPLDRIKRPKM